MPFSEICQGWSFFSMVKLKDIELYERKINDFFPYFKTCLLFVMVGCFAYLLLLFNRIQNSFSFTMDK